MVAASYGSGLIDSASFLNEAQDMAQSILDTANAVQSRQDSAAKSLRAA